MDTVALTLLSCFLFLFIGSFSLRISEKVNVPHSVILVLLGIIIALGVNVIQSSFPHLYIFVQFIDQFELSPELIFFVFLPTLLFESSFQIPLRKFLSDAVPIGILSIISYIISVAIISTGLYFVLQFFSFNLPFLFCLLFGVIISATDPVAVLAVFKKLGVTPRLTRLFEGESLFNDGTSWAAFIILLAFIESGHSFSYTDIPVMITQFLVMILGGIGFGIFMGSLFSKLIEKVKGEETVELTLTMIMAHVTFLLSDLSKHLLHFGEIEYEVSAIIATVVASMILGSKGIQKFSPSVRTHMHTFWEHFAFISNSLIFILIGMLSVRVFDPSHFHYFAVPTLLGILVTISARAISVRVPLKIYNLLLSKNSPHRMPSDWRKILSWASLRGAIAVAALLMIPENFTLPGWNFPIPVKEFLGAMIIGSILFTMFIKALSLEYFVKKMNLAEFSEIEQIEVLEGKLLMIYSVLKRLDHIEMRGYISKENADRIRKKYIKERRGYIRKISKIFLRNMSKERSMQVLDLHALAIEKKTVQLLLDNQEISEKIYWILFNKLLKQEDRIKTGQAQIQGEPLDMESIEKQDVAERYQIARARMVIISKVLRRLTELKEAEVCIPHDIFRQVTDKYEQWCLSSEKTINYITQTFPHIVKRTEYNIFSHFTEGLEIFFINELKQKSILDNRVSSFLKKKDHF